MPPTIVTRLRGEIQKVLNFPDVRERLAPQGLEPLDASPQEYGDYVKQESVRWADIVKAIGLTLNWKFIPLPPRDPTDKGTMA